MNKPDMRYTLFRMRKRPNGDLELAVGASLATVLAVLLLVVTGHGVFGDTILCRKPLEMDMATLALGAGQEWYNRSVSSWALAPSEYVRDSMPSRKR